MRARVVEMNIESGFGKATLESGETLPFDVSVSRLGVPTVGAEMEVEVGPSRLGGLKITLADIVPTWETFHVPCLCVTLSARSGDRHGSRREFWNHHAQSQVAANEAVW